MKKMENTAANNILKAIAAGHPLKALHGRGALTVAMWFDDTNLVEVALKHQNKYPEAFRAACYTRAMKGDAQLMNVTINAGTFVDGLDSLLDQSRSNPVLGACMCPILYNILGTGRQYGISDDQLEEVLQVINMVGQHFGFTLALFGSEFLAEIPYNTKSVS